MYYHLFCLCVIPKKCKKKKEIYRDSLYLTFGNPNLWPLQRWPPCGKGWALIISFAGNNGEQPLVIVSAIMIITLLELTVLFILNTLKNKRPEKIP